MGRPVQAGTLGSGGGGALHMDCWNFREHGRSAFPVERQSFHSFSNIF